MALNCHRSIYDVNPAAWDYLNSSAHPGLLHGFLSSLEDSGSIGYGTGWEPYYLTLSDHLGLAASVVCYFKTDSYGEYVFDFSWADAYYRHGINYYPKCLVAVPFTPSTGPRLMVRPDLDYGSTAQRLIAFMRSEFDDKVSTYHVLFPNTRDGQLLREAGWIERHGVQFHWENKGFLSFEDHLATFTSKRRKEVRREQRRVREQGITYTHMSGAELNPSLLKILNQCYQITYKIRGRQGYLNEDFFRLLAERIPAALAVAFAKRSGEPIAMSFCLKDQTTLYGRYWGALENIDCLHFDTCFHQWIDYSIRHGIHRFDPGAQGEHKIARGFAPTITKSHHLIQHPEFRDAIARHVRQENSYIKAYFEACDGATPFKIPDTQFRL